MSLAISKSWAVAVCCPLLMLTMLGACSQTRPRETTAKTSNWQDVFTVAKARLASQGSGRYFVLEPGLRLSYAGDDSTLTITVLNETKLVDGVQTRIVEERETKGGQLVEVSRNYFAIDPPTGDVYYFGEEVDIYKNGKVSSHEGAWLSGVNGASFGLMMPGEPKVGQRFYQERAPGVAMDRAEIASTTETVTTPAGTFNACVKTDESSGLEAGVGHKWYAPGVGLVKDDELELVKIERP